MWRGFYDGVCDIFCRMEENGLGAERGVFGCFLIAKSGCKYLDKGLRDLLLNCNISASWYTLAPAYRPVFKGV